MNNKNNEKGINNPLANEIAKLSYHELQNLLTPEQKNDFFECYGTFEKIDTTEVAEAVKGNGLLDSVFSAYDMIIRYAIFELKEAGQGSTADTILSVYDIIYWLQKSRLAKPE